MAGLIQDAKDACLRYLREPGGLIEQLETLGTEIGVPVPSVGEEQIVGWRAPAEVAQRDRPFPLLQVSCERVRNDGREKGRSFSGEVKLALDLHVSGTRTEQIALDSELLVEALLRVLRLRQGQWAAGTHHTGAYEVSFGPVKALGRGLVQTTTVSISLLACRD